MGTLIALVVVGVTAIPLVALVVAVSARGKAGAALQKANDALEGLSLRLLRVEARVDALAGRSPVSHPAPIPPPPAEKAAPSVVVPAPAAPPPPEPARVSVPMTAPWDLPLKEKVSAPDREMPETMEAKKPFLDWEKFTGVKLFAWAGGAALFLGAVFFAKYSMDHGWVTPVMRVIIGLAAGAGAIAGALWLRPRGYAVTVNALAASGTGMLYAVIFAAHTRYGFLGAVEAFGLMTLVTALAVLLADRLDSKFVAALALVGGFLTPPLLSTGKDNPLGLFGYVALLDAGVAVLAKRKKWDIFVFLAAVGTVVMQVGWYGKFFESAKAPTACAILGFFAVFFSLAQRWLGRERAESPAAFAAAGGIPLTAILFVGGLLGSQSPRLMLGTLLGLNVITALQVIRHRDFRPVHRVGGMVSFVILMAWTFRDLTPETLPLGLGVYLLFAALQGGLPMVLRRRDPTAPVSLWDGVFPSLMILPLMVGFLRDVAAPLAVWPALLVVDAIGLLAALASGVLVAGVAPLVFTLMVGYLWLGRLTGAGELGSFLLMLGAAVGLFFAGGIYLAKRFIKPTTEEKPSSGGWEDTALVLPALSASMPFFLLALVAGKSVADDPTLVFGGTAFLAALLLGLSLLTRGESLALAALGGVVVVEYTWNAAHFSPASAGGAFPWYAGFWGLFLLVPFVFKRKAGSSKGIWAAAALAGPVHIYLLHGVWKALGWGDWIGFLPALLAVVYLAGVAEARRIVVPEDTNRSAVLAWMGGVALFFISLIFPMAFDKEWITLGWALEGAALVWLYGRVEQRGLKMWGAALLLIAFARLALNPAALTYHARTETAVFNWYLYAYGAAAGCFFLAGRLWRPVEEKVAGVPVSTWARALGGVLLFILLNLEIADAFSTGSVVTFTLSGGLAQDMAYTLGWGLFALGLLVLGFLRAGRGARVAGTALMGVTALKLFLHDIWRLSQLYRVAAAVGSAMVLIVGSFLFQYFQKKETRP
jgi:uncharacterized membrane protein